MLEHGTASKFDALGRRDAGGAQAHQAQRRAEVPQAQVAHGTSSDCADLQDFRELSAEDGLPALKDRQVFAVQAGGAHPASEH